MKWLGALLCAAMLSFGVVACGSGGSSEPTEGMAAPPVSQEQFAARHRAAVRHHRRVVARRRAAQRRAIRHARLVALHRQRAGARQRHEEAALREAEETESAESDGSSECDPNYSGACLNPTASDYDCEGGSGDGPEYTGTVTVVGEDHYGLDSDGDGVACES